MNRFLKIVVSPAIILVSLGACGGTSGSSVMATPSPTIPEPGTPSSGFAEVALLSETLLAERILFPTLSPPPGTGTYSGTIVFQESADFTVDEPIVSYSAVGEANFDLVFATSKLSDMTASNVYEITTLGTTAATSEGTAISTNFTFDPTNQNISGTLTKVDGEVATYSIGLLGSIASGGSAQNILVSGEGTSSASGREQIRSGFAAVGVLQE